VIELAEAGDGHRALALPVELVQARAEQRQRAREVRHVHRTAAIDDGLQVGQARLGGPAVISHAHQHGGRCEERHVLIAFDGIEHVARRERFRGGDDVVRRLGNVR
jgi:hypothetical protein